MAMVIAIGIAVIIFLWWSRRTVMGGNAAAGAEAKPNCLWVPADDGSRRLRAYRCTACKAMGYSSSGEPPVQCKRHLGTGS